MYRTSSPSTNTPYNSPASGGSLLGANDNRFSSSPTSSPYFSQCKLPAEFRPSYPLVHQTMITKTTWIEAARTGTINFKMHGSPVPLVWVLVEDDVIPPNAVPFGEDKNGPLYIARALLEGGLHLGKAGAHLSDALIIYGGREHQVKTYEVLVCASQLRWGLASFESGGSLSQGTVLLAKQNQHLSQPGSAQADGSTLRETWSTHNSRVTWSSVGTTLCVNDIPRFMPNLEALVPSVDEGLNKSIIPGVDGSMKTNILPLFDDGLKKPIALPVDDDVKKLAGHKTVIMIDDSISMDEEQSWILVREALAGITDLMNQYGSQGIDLHFLHHHNCHTNIKTSQGVQQIFDQMYPDGQDTPTAAKLEELINRHLPLVERKHPRHEPIHIIVITDGVATDNDAFPEIIVSAAHRLERNQVPHEMFRIQFVQVGTDPEAAATLWALGDRLARESQIRDIADFTPYDPQQGAFNAQYMLKILLRSINGVLDNGGLASWEERQAYERRVEVRHVGGTDTGAWSWGERPMSERREDVHEAGGISEVLHNGSSASLEERQALERRVEVHHAGGTNKVLDNEGAWSWGEHPTNERRVEVHEAGGMNKVLRNGSSASLEECQALEVHHAGGTNEILDNGGAWSWGERSTNERRVEVHEAGGMNKVLRNGSSASLEECQAPEVHHAGGTNEILDNGGGWSWGERQESERRVEVHEAGGINEVLHNGSPALLDERQTPERRVEVHHTGGTNKVLDNGGRWSWGERKASERRVDVLDNGSLTPREECQASETVQADGINKALDDDSLWLSGERKASESPVEVHQVGGTNQVLDNGGAWSWGERKASERPVEVHEAGGIDKVLDTGSPVSQQEPQASERPVQPCSINKVLEEESLRSWEEREASERPVEVHEVDGINKMLDNGSPTSREERQASEKLVQPCSVNKVLGEESLWTWEERQTSERRVEVHQSDGINKVLDNGDPASWEERQASEGRVQASGINKVLDDGGLWLWEERQAYEKRVEEHKGCERREEVHEMCERQVEVQQGSRAQEVTVCSACGRA